jgi:hypothetical protein
MPKSITRAVSPLIITLAGLMSRCTRRFSVREADRLENLDRDIGRAQGAIAPPSLIAAESVLPSTYSNTSQGFLPPGRRRRG